MRFTLIVVLISLLLAACGNSIPSTLDYGNVPEFAAENLIPVLAAPTGAQLYGGGGGGGGNGMGMGVVFGSPLSMEEVYQHYADQLEAAGWRFISRQDQSEEVQSFWELTDSLGGIWPARLDITLGAPDDPAAYNVNVQVLQQR